MPTPPPPCYSKKMTVTKEELEHLSAMSGLPTTQKENSSLIKDLDNIINYISQLDELDTEGIEPTYQVSETQNIWREDILEQPETTREDLLNLAAETKDNQIKVPKVL